MTHSHRLCSLSFAAVSVLVLGAAAGCDTYVEPATPSGAYVQTTSAPAAPASQESTDDVVYVQDAPVQDFDDYPSVVYGGVTVYYVGGTWYRHDERGWGEYRQEPPQLARQRSEHERDPRWVQARERPAAPPARQVAPAQVEQRPAMQAAPPAQGELRPPSDARNEAAPVRRDEPAPAQAPKQSGRPVRRTVPTRPEVTPREPDRR